MYDSTGINIGTGGEFQDADTITFCVGPNAISSIADNYLLSVYPNPANDQLNMSIPNAFVLENPSIAVYSTTGQLIWNGKMTDVKTSISTTNWSNGVYMIQVASSSRTISKRIVVTH
jgi:hypothetical protein